MERRTNPTKTVSRARRWALLAGALAALALPALAVAAVELKLDASAYPTVRGTVVTGKPSDTAPALSEGGEPVVGLTAENLGRAKSVVVGIDSSKSMKGKPFADAVAAARAFIAGKPQDDRIAVVTFGSKAIQLTGFTGATIDADIALRTLGVDETTGTALYDAIGIASRSLASEELPAHVLIILTDGADFGSASTIAEAISAAKDANVAVYPIGIEGKEFSRAPLERIARETGGTYYGVKSTAALRQIYSAVAEELRRTWQLEYVTAVRPGETFAVEAVVDGQGLGSTELAVPASFGSGATVSDGESTGFLPKGLYRSSWGPAVFAVVIGLIVLLALGTALTSPKGSWLRDRLAPHVGASRPQVVATRQRRGAGSVLSALYGVTERAFGRKRSWGKLQRLLQRADVPLRTVEFVWLMAGCGFVVMLIAAAAGSVPLALPVAFVAGGISPLGIVWLKARRRVRAFDDQLPDLLITLAASLKAGHSFHHAIGTLVEEGQPPASTEFKRVLTEARLGRPMNEALAEMAQRVGSTNFDYVVTAVTIQQEVGGGLAGLFDMVAETVRNRQQFRRKIRGLTAMGRMSAYVLIGLPFFIAGAITVLNAEYMDPLYHTSTGHILIIIGLSMMTFGSLILTKIVSFKG